MHKVNRYDIHGKRIFENNDKFYFDDNGVRNAIAGGTIAEQATREREFGNLRSIKDNYPKYVISMTPLLTKNDDDGITNIHLRKFLREGL